MNDLEVVLQEHGIPYHSWGTGSAKTLNHLKKEIREQEARLISEPEGLVREISVACVTVLHTDSEGTTYKLVEDKQVFSDGRSRKRSNLEGSIFEKIRLGEKPHHTAQRALVEELQIENHPEIILKSYREEHKTSQSYPGLLSRAHLYFFETMLPERNNEGYSEIQPDKTTFWRWDPLTL